MAAQTHHAPTRHSPHRTQTQARYKQARTCCTDGNSSLLLIYRHIAVASSLVNTKTPLALWSANYYSVFSDAGGQLGDGQEQRPRHHSAGSLEPEVGHQSAHLAARD